MSCPDQSGGPLGVEPGAVYAAFPPIFDCRHGFHQLSGVKSLRFPGGIRQLH
jgi:hypothetical protein